MPFDVFTMAAVRDELDRVTVGARVDKVLQTSGSAVAMKLWRPGWSGHLVMSAAASQARVYLTADKLAKGFETPSPFLMLLRKYCTAARIESVRQMPLERVLFVHMATHELGGVTVTIEIMGNHSNVILLAADQTILGAIKLIGPRQSRYRRVLPHVPYLPPPVQSRAAAFGKGSKLDPTEESERAEIEAALEAADDVPATTALTGLLRGCSPTAAADIARRAGLPSAELITSPQVPAIMVAIRDQYSILETHLWSPVVVLRDGRPRDFKAYDEPPVEEAKPAGSMSAAIEAVSAGVESSDSMSAGRARVHADLARRRSTAEARVASLGRALDSAGDAAELLEAGNLVLGLQHQIAHGADTLLVEGMDRAIALDPKRSVVENAESYFKRYRKARDAAKRVPNLVEAARRELEFIQELDTYVDLAETPTDLDRIQSEARSRFGERSEPKRKPPPVGRILSVDLGRGARAIVGRSARQNEEVTFKMAGRGDIWLHARDVPGAHVVARGLPAEAQDVQKAMRNDAVRNAASLAAYYSKARNERAVDVIVVRVRDVHRIAGGAPGQVTVRNERTVRVRPASAEQIAPASSAQPP
jgi:predicted ribosome quality control (RQC) complex YloA/Tae2 family protein